LSKRVFLAIVFIITLVCALIWTFNAQNRSEVFSATIQYPPIVPNAGEIKANIPITSTSPPTLCRVYGMYNTRRSLEGPYINRQSILLWPKDLLKFMNEYQSWKMWLGSRRISPHSVRDELLVSVRAIAAMVHDLEIEVDDPDSNLIIISGNPVALSALLDRLRGHPLLEQVTEDSPARRKEGRRVWNEIPTQTYGFFKRPTLPKVNVRNPWVTNVVWGYSAPYATISITLTRDTYRVLTTTTIAGRDGLYHAYLAWEIKAGDTVEVNDGIDKIKIPVIPMKASGDASTDSITGSILPAVRKSKWAPGVHPNLEVTIGHIHKRVTVNDDGTFTIHLDNESFHSGTPGFLVYVDDVGNRIFMPFSASLIGVRRSTEFGLPWGSSHSMGISSIVWGFATPGATLMITLTRSNTLVVTRTVTSDQVGYFSVSMDHFIEDGDTIEVLDGTNLRIVQVPTITFQVDPATKIISGIAPANITKRWGGPHSLEVSIGWHTYPITTTSSGEFTVSLSANPYIAGLLGAFHYVTQDGNWVYKPLFVADPLIRGKPGDWRADTILGQPDFSQITFNEVVSNHLFNPGGIYVDRSCRPNRIYVYDSGNSRVLGLSHLGICLAGANEGQDCTTNSDCPGATCQIQEDRAADIVLGQPSFNASACNGDSGYQIYPDVPMASTETLCGLREETISVSESGSAATLATDAQGNLYVPDFYNNRILRYNDPFATDAIADYVWGQADFSGVTCNRGAGYSHTDARSLCLSPVPGYGSAKAGVTIDHAGNLWVADTQNNRVLRFPFDPALGRPADEADLVLGQPDFSTTTPGVGLNQMHNPASVRVDTNGAVYVADGAVGTGQEGRILVFEPPLSNGMPASWILTNDVREPTGLEIAPNGGIWVNDEGNDRFILFVNGVISVVVEHTGETRSWGGLGVDEDGNLIITGWDLQEILHLAAPSYTVDSIILRAHPDGIFNYTGQRGLYGGMGLEVAAGQLIYADGKRILFWNNPWDLTNYKPADGVIGQPDFHTRPRWGREFGRMRADDQGRLWVIYGCGWCSWESPVIYGYKLPLDMGAVPVLTITSPLPLQGGGVFTWTGGLVVGGIDVDPDCNCLWLSDPDTHRAFRIRDVITHPVVDIVLGQLNASGMECNQGRGRDFPSQDSLCNPGPLTFDEHGNLWISDHNLEVNGNLRLLEFDADTIPDAPTSAVFGIPATRVLGRNGDFTEPNCLPREQDPICGPWEPAFDSQGRMVIGFNGYSGLRFPVVYQDPLTNPLPVAALSDFHSMPLSARFDQFDNLYILDHNRSRILIYKSREVQTYIVTGTIKTSDGDPIPGVRIETLRYASGGVSDASGAYTLTGLVTGTYQLIPSKKHYVFTPVTRIVSVPAATANQDFVGHYIPTTATIITPLAGATVCDVVTVTVEGTFDSVELYLDDVLHGIAGGQSAHWSWSTRQVTNGLHTLRVIPYDDEGRMGISQSVTVTVSNTPLNTPWLLSGMDGLTVLDLAVSPRDRQVLYAVVEESAVYKTIDAGMFWIKLSKGIPSNAGLSSLAINPDNDKIAYVGSGSGGIYKTMDGGYSWFSTDVNALVNDLAIALSDEQILYAAGWGVYRTMDGGKTWDSVLTDEWFKTVAIDPMNPQTIYVGSSVIHKTIDGGGSWITQTVGNLSGQIHVILIDPYNTKILYAGKLWEPGGIYKSTDGGISWVQTGLEYGFNSSLAMAPNDSQVLYAGDIWGGIYKSGDGGTSWSNVSEGLPSGMAVTALAVDPTDSCVVYAGLSGGGVWKTVYVPPIADFTASPTSGIAPLRVVFTNTSTGDYTASLWDFGDGMTSTLKSPTHVYETAGVYTVTLTVSGPGGSDREVKADYITVGSARRVYLPLTLRNG